MDFMPFLIWWFLWSTCVVLLIWGMYLVVYPNRQSSGPSKGTQPIREPNRPVIQPTPVSEPPAPEPIPDIDPRLAILTAAWQARRDIDEASIAYLRHAYQQINDAAQIKMELMFKPPLNGSVQLFALEQSLANQERSIIDTLRQQELAIDAFGAKGSFGISKIAEVHEHASRLFEPTADYILDVKNPILNEETRAYVAEFSRQQVKALARQTMGTLEITASSIARIVHESPYPPPKPPEPPKKPKPRSLLKMLIG
jgi:hypothetical protein